MREKDESEQGSDTSSTNHTWLRATNEVRCMATTRHGFVLTGHIDGYVRAWNLDGTKLESESWPAELRMHNTGITVLVEDYEGAIWTASMAGSVRCISQDGKKTSIEAKAPGRKNAHNTEVNAMIATANKTLWTGAKTVLCMLSSRGKVRRSLQFVQIRGGLTSIFGYQTIMYGAGRVMGM
ncbi:hypothetical protein GUITHDRAFT_101648 [Guillardia theta CCMP2712]|uniref:Uncharacterized protein n=1 Tax=Guillardia theta (strain CCMP2712) TaxID=905079 RepID=L1JVR6_GUITC|nr:hypothetical protein GUITHDRAFT_101648 [Guillardia theta CCMP2712]EKX52477.1 hypothetical protein GUITHDRAFT_101648 [Guillardia theta CCMP2712]|eukprot:XP_005839457.1 hypothetical protein GUITHDRAFT_101648 [Guillardia theta CCMP2712]